MDYTPLIYAGIALVALFVIGLMMMRLYRRSTKETTYVRTGFRGMHVIKDGGGFVFPVLHEIMPVNMNTMPIVISKADNDSLRTKDKLRVNVTAEFYVRVKPDAEAIGIAAQTLGRKTQDPHELKSLIQGKLEDALRSVAAKMVMEDLNTNRMEFVQEVQKVAAHELSLNGLELESVSLTGLNQTKKDFFDENNAFDAEGLAILTAQIQQRRQERNATERNTEVAIAEKDREANLARLDIARQDREATLAQEQTVAVLEAEQGTVIAQRQAEQVQASEQARIQQEQAVRVAEIEAARAQEVAETQRQQAIETAKIEQQKAVKLADQQREIAIANASGEQSKAVAAAELARADAVRAQQEVITVTETATADRAKRIAVIDAEKVAEVAATGIRVAATAEKDAATERAEAKRLLAQGTADATLVEARATAEAEMVAADATEKTLAVQAEGEMKLNAAANSVQPAVLANRYKIEALKVLPDLVTAATAPLEKIDSIKIVSIGGLTGAQGTGSESLITNGSTGNLAEDAVQAALRYRTQKPVIDGLVAELFGDGKTLDDLITPSRAEVAAE